MNVILLRAALVWLVCFCLPPLRAGDFSVTQGYNDGVGTRTYSASAGTVQLGSPDARWFWYLNFAQPGYYDVSAQVSVAAANAGATLRVGDYVPQHGGPGSFAAASLAATDPVANRNPQWQPLGQVWVPAPGLRFFFAQIPGTTGNPGLLHAIRVSGPGPVTVDPAWTVRAAACDIYFSPSGSTRRASYAEMVSRPLPIPAISGTHTVVNMATGYMGNNDSCFNSLWVANGQLPTPLTGFGPSRVYTHEGTGSTITLKDFYLDPTRRRKTLQISVPDGNGNTLSTFLTGEVGQRWYLGGRMRQYTSVGASSSGFLENPSAFNSHVNLRSCAWGNVWAYGSQSGGANAWWANTTIRGHLRGPSPATLPGVTGVYPYGTVRQRQDMVEMIIGGLVPIARNDTTLTSLPPTPPDLPSLNLAYNLAPPSFVNQAAHATAGTAYTDSASLRAQIRDPFSTLGFTYQKIAGPAWLSVSSAGVLSGTPSAANAGQNLLTIQAADPNAGLTGQFTAAVYVRAAGGANNAPVFQYVPPEKMTVSTTDDAILTTLPVLDPDGGTHTFSITSGNTGGQFGFNGDRLVKTAALTPGAVYPLTIRVTDDGTPPLSSTVDVTVTAVADSGGLTEEIWYLTEGLTLADFTADPRYPDSPTQLSALTDFTESAAALSTGYRVSGYLYPPATGTYTFFMTGSDVDGELRVSTTASSANLALKATTTGTTGTAVLTAGQRYYIEALGMNGADYGSGSFTVQWAGPGVAKQTIPAASLRPIRRATPALWTGTNVLRSVVTGEAYQENLRSKLDTIHLWNVLAYQKTSGPAWITISPDGMVTGTPGTGDTGVNTATVRVTAPGGHWDEKAFSITVIADTAPQFTSSTITRAALAEGTEITGTLASYCSDPDVGSRLGFGDQLTYSLVSGPAWLGVEPTGELYGKPGGPHTGLNTFTVRATDLGGLSATAQLQFTVTDIANTPAFTRNPVAFAVLSGEPLTESLAPYVYDPDAGEVLTFTRISGPAWLNIAADGTLTGTPADSDKGLNTFSVRVTDSTSRASTGTLTIDVRLAPFFVYDGFNAVPGADITAHATGTGWSGTWTGTDSGAAGFTVNAAGIPFSSLPGSGYSVSNGTASGVACSRDLSRTIQVGGSGGSPEAWIAGVIRLSGTAAGQRVEVNLGNTGIAFGKQLNGSLGLLVNGVWSPVTNSGGSATSIAPSGTYLFLLRMVENGPGTDLTLFLGTSAAMNLSSTANFPYQVSQSAAGAVSFDSLRLYVNKPDPQDVDFDEICVASSYAEAVSALTVYDGFDAAPGAGIAAHSTGTGWAGNWSGPATGAAGFTVNPAGLAFGALQQSGRSITNGTGSNVSYSRPVARPVQVGGAGAGTEAWVSGVISLTGTAAGQSVDLSLGSAGISIGKQPNGPLGLKVNGTWFPATDSGGASTGITPDGTWLFALRLLASGAGTDLTLFLGNDPARDLSTTTAFSWQVTRSLPGPVFFDSLGLGAGKPDPQNADVDEIRIARTYAAAVPPVPKPQITLTAAGTPGEEGPVTADFTITRLSTGGTLTIPFTVSGTAAAGADYLALPVSVTIPDGASEATVTVIPVDDAEQDPGETVVLTISPDAAYLISGPASATLTIVDNDGPHPVGPPWTARDTGAVNPGANSSTLTPAAGLDATDRFTLTGSGSITSTSTSDGMHFVSQPVSGDCEIVARIASQTGTASNSRAGVAIRDGTAGNAPAAQTMLRGGTRTPQFTWRTSAGAANANSAGPAAVSTPYWVRLVRTGDVFTSFVSPDGTTWTQNGTAVTLTNMPPLTEVGLFVSSGSTTGTNTAVFDSVDVRQNIVSVEASAPAAAEGDPVQTATVTVSRGPNPPGSPLSLDLTLTGTAIAGTDYTLSGGSVSLTGTTTATVVIPAGQAGISLTITPLQDLLNEGTEDLILTAAAGVTYALGTPVSAVTAIADAPVASLTLLADPAPGGSVSGAGTYPVGSLQSITAIPAPGWHFVSWNGAGISRPGDATTTVTIDGAKTLTATFAADFLTLGYSAAAHGTLTGTTVQSVSAGGNGSTVTAVPDAGYLFARWSDGSRANPRTDTGVTADITVSAEFALCRIRSISLTSGRLTLRVEGTPGIGYDVSRSTDLQTWVPVASDLIAPVDGLFDFVDDPVAGARAFYRISVH